jgi:hypothetical protein
MKKNRIILAVILLLSFFKISRAQVSTGTAVVTATPEVGCCSFFKGTPPVNWNLSPRYWNFGDGPSVALNQDTVSHCYSMPGTYLVNYSVVSSGHFGYTTYSGQVSVHVTGCVAGINEVTFENSSFTVFPNPVAQILNIELKIKNADLKIIDMLSNIVKQQNISAENTSIDISDLPEGVYFVQVKASAGILTKKIIVNKN